MGEHKLTGCDNSEDPAEKEFRRKNNWHTFMGGTYTALASATFLAVLGKAFQMAIDAANGKALELTPLASVVVAAGTMFGIACGWMATRESTEVRCLGDEHLAYQYEKSKAKQKAQEIAKVSSPSHEEFPDQCRKDGKSWVIASASQQAVQAVGINL